jgi:multisubunit Na+/H+ antiporter MnhB subunit
VTAAAWVFDVVHLATIVTLAWGSVTARDPFTGIVRFIAFGLLAALAWARLGAPDLALAEAAIGAGLTGALLLSTLGRMRSRQRAAAVPADGEAPAAARPLLAALVFALGLVVGLLVLTSAWSIAGDRDPSAGPVDAELLAESGIESEVAAVLLDVRGYDTLLEMAVLFVALLAVWCLGVVRFRRPPWPDDPVLTSLAGLMVPILLLLAAHLLAAGLHEAGGGFQAGAVLAAGGVLWTLADRRALRLGVRPWARIGLVAGLVGMVAAAAAPTFAGRPPLDQPAETASTRGFLLELGIAVSVGLTLTALFAGGLAERPLRQLRREREARP